MPRNTLTAAQKFELAAWLKAAPDSALDGKTIKEVAVLATTALGVPVKPRQAAACMAFARPGWQSRATAAKAAKAAPTAALEVRLAAGEGAIRTLALALIDATPGAAEVHRDIGPLLTFGLPPAPPQPRLGLPGDSDHK